MKILLTNDDGYEAENIKNLYEKLSQDHEVWIIAPKDNCSGMSAAISYLKEIPVDKISDRVYAVDGTPADCSYLGLLSIEILSLILLFQVLIMVPTLVMTFCIQELSVQLWVGEISSIHQ